MSFFPRYTVRRVVAVFAAAVLLNYVWELSQSPLYLPPSRLNDVWWHCFVASLGDGALVVTIYATCALLFGEPDWYLRAGPQRYVAVLANGLAVGLLVEWVGLRMHRWEYADTMPLLPGLNLGLVPIAQMLVLPPLVFRIASRLAGRPNARA